MSKKFIKDYAEQIRQMKESGHSTQEIADSTGFHPDNIRKYLRKISPPQTRKLQILEENEQEILKMHNEGKTLKEIGAFFNCSDGLISIYFRKKNIVPDRILLAKQNSPEAKKEEIIERYNNGETVYSLYKDLNIPYPTLCDAMKRWGLDIAWRKKLHTDGLLKDKTAQIINLYTQDKLGIVRIANILGASPSNVRVILQQHGLMRKYEDNLIGVNESYFEYIDTPNKAYILGFLYADGNVDCRERKMCVSISYKDVELLEKIKLEMEYEGDIHLYETNSDKPKYKNPMANLTISRKKICRDLIKWGCVPNKTWQLRFPTFLSDELLPHFIRGYWDGDGHIAKTGYVCSIVGNQYVIAELGVKLPTQKYNVYAKNSDSDPMNKILQLQVSQKSETQKVLSYLYGNCENYLYLDRKYKRAQEILHS